MSGTNGHAGNGKAPRTTCKRCSGPLPEGRRSYCSPECSAKRGCRAQPPVKPSAPVPKIEECFPEVGDTIRTERLKRHVVSAMLAAGDGRALPQILEVLLAMAQGDGKDGRPLCNQRTRRLAAVELGKLYVSMTSGKDDPTVGGSGAQPEALRGLSMADVGALLRATRETQWGPASN